MVNRRSPRVSTPDGRTIAVSVSHTDDLSAVAIADSRQQVGVDIESFAPPLNPDAIQLASFTARERTHSNRSSRLSNFVNSSGCGL